MIMKHKIIITVYRIITIIVAITFTGGSCAKNFQKSSIVKKKSDQGNTTILSETLEFSFINPVLELTENWSGNETAKEVPIPSLATGSLLYPISAKALNSGIKSLKNLTRTNNNEGKKKSAMRSALQLAALQGLEAMVKLYEQKEPDIIKKGDILDPNSPGARLSLFSAAQAGTEQSAKAAYAALVTAKKLKESMNVDFLGLGRQTPPRVSLRRTPLEGLCSPRDQPRCLPVTKRYRTHDGTCNNEKRPRWGSAQMPFHRFMTPDYADGIESIRGSVLGGPLPSARFVSLLVHGARDDDSPVTLMLAQWGQFIDHDITATAQPRTINGSVPQCCGSTDFHPSCLPIKVPRDDPWLAPLRVRCLEFLRSAPAQRRDCILSWREQTNQATSFLDASMIYSSNTRLSENSRHFRDGLLLFGRGPPRDDVCLRAALANQCIRPGDARSGEQPGLLALHTVWVGEHNRIAIELGILNPHWSDEKIYQETRRIIGAMVQHITYREFLPLVLGREVCKLFDLMLLQSGYYKKYNPKINPTVANSFGAAAFRFGHSLIQGTFLRSDRNHHFMTNNVTLHQEFSHGDMGSAGSLHRLLRGMVMQRALKRDEFITPELTNHLFQSDSFPFGLDLAAINIQRGRDHGLPSYTSWRGPCGLSPVRSWTDFDNIVGPHSSQRIQQAYSSVDDVDLFVGGIAERPVVGGLVGPTFACILAQQFSNLRKGDRFWYENENFENSFTSAQLESLRQVTLSQVLCRALGGGTLQPHAFLPPDIPGNERQLCGKRSLIRLDLLPWTEHDPFNKQNTPMKNVADSKSQSSGFVINNKPTKLIPPFGNLEPLTNAASNSITNKVEFVANNNNNNKNPTNVPIHIPTNNSNNKVNNKLDLSGLTNQETKRPLKLKNPTSTTIINDKLGNIKKRKIRTTTAIPLVSKRLQQTKTTQTITTTLTTKRPTKTKKRRKPNNRNRNRITQNRRQDSKNNNSSDHGRLLFSGIFKNEDNATGYIGNKPISFSEDSLAFKDDISHNKADDYSDVTSLDEKSLAQISIDTSTPSNIDIEISIKPSLTGHPIYRPITLTSTKYPEINRRPAFSSITPLQRPLTSHYSDIPFKHSTPFSYDIKTTPKPNLNYDFPYQSNYYNADDHVPIFTSPPNRFPNDDFYRPNLENLNNRFQYGTSAKPDLQTYLLIGTTRRTTPVYIYQDWTTTRRPSFNNNYSPNSLNSHSYYPSSFFSSSSSPTFDHSLTDSVYSSYFSSTTKKPLYRPLTMSSQLLFSNQQTNKRRIQFNKNFTKTVRKKRPTRLPKQTNITTTTINLIDDYDITTYIPILNDDLNENFNNEQNNETSFDKDGYLRPEHMNLPLINSQTGNLTMQNDDELMDRQTDDFILPIFSKDFKTINGTTTQLQTDIIPADSIPRKPNFDIESETDYLDLTEHQQQNGKIENRSRPSDIPFVPLVILTSADRPDTWVMTDGPKKAPLPEMPQINSGKEFTQEIPRPMTVTKDTKDI